MIELVAFLALTFCGARDLECRGFMEDCLLDEGISQYNLCKKEQRVTNEKEQERSNQTID